MKNKTLYEKMNEEVIRKERLEVKNDWLKIKRTKKENHYKISNISCCINCKFSSRMSTEDMLECSFLNNLSSHFFSETYVNEMGVCDKYKRVKNK